MPGLSPSDVPFGPNATALTAESTRTGVGVAGELAVGDPGALADAGALALAVLPAEAVAERTTLRGADAVGLAPSRWRSENRS